MPIWDILFPSLHVLQKSMRKAGALEALVQYRDWFIATSINAQDSGGHGGGKE